MQSRLVLLAVTTSVAVAGCGSADTQAPVVAATAHRFMVALSAGSVDEACSLLDQHGQSLLKHSLAPLMQFAHTGGNTASCPAEARFLRDAVMTPHQLQQLTNTKPTEVSVSGSTAKARIGGNFWLSKSQAGWRIDELPISGG
ncbi:MAG TPA: hypothetical protein VHT27_05780 [Solirubrobacteraceae bacterium]|nr:hypothetical protein [Solirubrobacteraceae bacterium]